jgi:3-oxoadipate enol-lactonase
VPCDVVTRVAHEVSVHAAKDLLMDILLDDRVNASISGEGPTLVLLHSLLAGRSSFDPVVPSLSKRFRVVVPELPGFGRSPAVAGGLVGVADAMAGAVRKAAPNQKPILLGNGYGGFIVLQMALRRPGIASRLVFADCGARFSEPGREAFRNMAKVAAAKGLEAIADVALRRLFAPDFQAAHPELIAGRRAAFLATHSEVFQTACHDLASLDVTHELPNVATPALVMVGERDEATPPEMSVALAKGLPDAELRILRGCAHVPQLQDPEQFLAELLPFLDRSRA